MLWIYTRQGSSRQDRAPMPLEIVKRNRWQLYFCPLSYTTDPWVMREAHAKTPPSSHEFLPFRNRAGSCRGLCTFKTFGLPNSALGTSAFAHVGHSYETGASVG
jgi:hypothetical protein